jgi:DNA-binding NtrC family response regulator
MVQNFEGQEILVVDDDKYIRELLRIFLTFKFKGCNIKTFDSGVTALKYVLENGTNVVISDVYMESLDGPEFISLIHELDPAIPVIAMTADNDLKIEIEARAAGSYAFFLKPIELELLAKTVEAAMENNIQNNAKQ